MPDVIDDQYHFLERSLEIAAAAGVAREQIVLDPGFGFAKDAEENLELMARFAELHRFGLPLLAGTSRKRFIGAVTGRDAPDRDVGTAATSALLRLAGRGDFPSTQCRNQQGCAGGRGCYAGDARRNSSGKET